MIDATIAAAASISGDIDLGPLRLEGVIMPAAWTAADLTFQVSRDGSAFQNLFDDADNEVIVQAAASRNVALRDDVKKAFSGWRWLRVRSGTSGTPVAQAAERTIGIQAGGAR